MQVAEGRLDGIGVLVTRPLEQARELARMIAQAGGNAILFPSIEIRCIALTPQSEMILHALHEYDLAIFISMNAAYHGLRALRSAAQWPDGCIPLAVGEATARALRAYGLSAVIAPEDGSDSEALLRLHELQKIEGKRILIVRGLGGRELLATKLREHGARVDYFECYERALPKADPAIPLQAFSHGRVQAVTINSREGMENLFTLLGEAGYSYLCDTPMFVLHPRIADRAHEKGVREVIVTPPGERALIESMSTYFAQC